jgi:CRISPR-associated protein Cmr2
MGQALSQLNSAEEHQQFSQQLSRFAGEARNIVHDKRGVLIYSGGDDVLAFVPVDQCLGCARALHERFGQLMRPWTERTQTSLTLSVGLAIGHFLENLEDLLGYGRAAEKHAKQPRTSDGKPRDGLAVHLLKRGGGPIDVRANWSERTDQDLRTLAQWINDRAISGRVAYDLRKIADIYDTWPAETVADAIRRDTLSVMKGKQPRGESRMNDVVERFIEKRVTNAATLRRLAEELLIARQLAVALRQANHQPGSEEI